MSLTIKYLIIAALAVSFINAECPHEQSDLGRWSDPSVWEDGNVPQDHQEIVITKPILLDTKTSLLGGIKIQGKGKLVFLPESDLKLTTDYVLIENGGRMDIGSEDCRFKGKAEILLTGIRNDGEDIENFGQKFIGVGVDGHLEIHGEDKLSWTKLDGTLSPKPKIYETDIQGQPNKRFGIIIYEFSVDGNLLNIYDGLWAQNSLQAALKSLAPDSVVIVTKTNHIWRKFKNDLGYLQSVIETDLGLNSGTLKIKDELTSGSDSIWTMILNRNDLSSLKESFNNVCDDACETEKLYLKIGDIEFLTYFTQKIGGNGKTQIFIETRHQDYDKHQIALVDDVSSWNVGDKIVIASTDFNWEQAEEFEIIEVNGNTLKIKGELFYEHFGVIDSNGIDMRAEVGVLTRNIRIHGEMENHCYGEETNYCNKVDYDNFGGHTKAIENFGTYIIQGAELFHMGQMSILGRYPIHYHITNDTTRDGKFQYIQGNSIHHTFSRCVTIHASHHVHVLDNFGYNHHGHCMFLEDSAERGSVLKRNLVIGTKVGYLTPGDLFPTSFWITSPLTILEGNVAAGSDTKSGFGIWYLFADKPVGPSTELGFFKEKEAKHTPITRFLNNVAHSNGNSGLALFRRLGTDHGVLGCSTYDPRVNPLDKKSNLSPVVFDGYIGYKNRRFNAIMRATASELINFKISDSLVGVRFVRNMFGGYQRIRNSVIVAQSDNLGNGEFNNVMQENGKYIWKYVNQSFPIKFSDRKFKGISLEGQGPTHLENVNFRNFNENNYHKATAIEWVDKLKHQNGVKTSAKGLTFTNTNQENYIFQKNEENSPGDSSVLMNDLDGSLTGSAGSVVVRPGMYFTRNFQCQPKPEWNLQICPTRFIRFSILTSHKDLADQTFITDESNQIINEQTTLNLNVAYTQTADDLYVVNWRTKMPKQVVAKYSGLKNGEEVILGLCLPLEVKNVDFNRFQIFTMNVDVSLASSLNELKNNSDMNLFYDTDKSIVYAKYREESNPQNELADCSGDLAKGTEDCPSLRVNLNLANIKLGGNLNFNDGDCTGR